MPLFFKAHLKKHSSLKLRLGVWLFFWINCIYFLNQQFVFFPIAVLEPGPVDLKIPFIVESIYIYECLYLLIPMAPLFMVRRKFLLNYAIVFTCMVGVCGLFFFFMPTLCPRPQAASHWMYDGLMALDRPLNSLPSMHVAMAIYAVAALELVLAWRPFTIWIRIVLWLLVVAISISTMTLKQHFFIDVLSGAGIGIISSLLLIFITHIQKKAH